MNIPLFYNKFSKRIRVRLISAFVVVVFLSICAVLTAWISITRTQDRIDAIVTETLPLVSSSLKLDREASLFALTLSQFSNISTRRDHEILSSQLENHITEIQIQLQSLDLLNFERDTIHLIQEYVEGLVEFMEEQDAHFNNFFSARTRLSEAAVNLRKKQQEFIALASPRITESYKTFLQRGAVINSELREVVALLKNDSSSGKIKKIDDKIRIGLETLLSSAAGEMRSNLEVVALTYFAAGLLYEAVNAPDIMLVKQLEDEFLQAVPKLRKLQLILQYSTPDNYQILKTVFPIFRFGTGEQSIFALRTEELTYRHSASQSAKEAFNHAEDLTTTIDNLTISSQTVASQSSRSLQSSLNTARLIQAAAGFLSIIFSILIGWFYVEKQVISRLSSLQKSMEIHSEGGQTEIPLAGNDEISEMAIALQSFVTQRSNVEQKLHRALDELNAVMNSIDYGIVFINRDLKIQLVNKAFLRMWNIDYQEPAKLDQTTLRELINLDRDQNVYSINDDFDNSLGELEAMVQNGNVDPVEIETKGGKIYQHQCIKLPDGGRMLTYFDITELKVAQKNLVESQKMETIGLMAGGVAHDLNNILSGIVSYPDLLLLKLPSDSELIKPIKIIKESGRRASEVVADLLTVARGAAAKREVTSLNQLITEYLYSPEGQNLNRLYPRITITTDLDPLVFNFSCSPTHIKKCVMNLVINAAEAITELGRINISTKNRAIEKSDSSKVNIPQGEYIVLSVWDNGPGIPADDIDHIFEPFYSKKVMGRSGTGLGLTIVWNTVQEHNGTITVASNGKGTTFDLFFPVTRESITDKSQPIFITDIEGSEEHILVVDDEEIQRNLARQILTSLNYRVTTAASGEEAIELTKTCAYDLVILDMIMSPGINGITTLKQILHLHPKQKAVIASGYSGENEIQQAWNLGAEYFIKKPYTVRDFGQAVKRALNHVG